MYHNQKKNTLSSSNDPIQEFPRLTERLSMKKSVQKFSCNFDEVQLKQKQNDCHGGLATIKWKDGQKYLLNKNNSLKNSFEFLYKNTLLMDRTLNNLTLRNHDKSYLMKALAYQNIKKKQIKLDKIKKEEWIAVHKRINTNFAKFNDNEQRKVYRSRKKYFETSVQTFIARQQKSSCLEDIFPTCRLNSVMISLTDRQTNPKLLLLGGLSSEMNTKLHFHQYQPTTHLWQKVKNQQSQSTPQFNLSQHVVVTYQKNIYLIGGIAVIPSHTEHKNQRYSIPFITCFNSKTSKWSRINWNTYLRTHAASTFANYAIIDGGISEEDHHSTKIYLMDLSKQQSPVLVSTRGLGLSHHRIVSTEGFQDKSRSFLRFDGLVCYGGRKENGELNNRLYLMNYDYRMNQIADKFGKYEWQALQTVGKMPEPRYMHTMDLLQTKSSIFERKAYCAILGGIGQKETILNDFWLLDLSTLQWSQVLLSQSQCLVLENGIAGHCSAAEKNKLYIFGGYDQNREYINKFWTINVESGFQTVKKQHRMINRQKQQQ